VVLLDHNICLLNGEHSVFGILMPRPCSAASTSAAIPVTRKGIILLGLRPYKRG